MKIIVNKMEVTLAGYDGYSNLTHIIVKDTQGKEYQCEVVRHGYWKDEGGYNVCSLCAADFDKYDDGGYLQDFDYCPKCGAKMDLEEKNESN